MNLDFVLRPFDCNRRGMMMAVGLAIGLSAITAAAFPPAPHHSIYGLVRNERGDPLTNEHARIIFTTEDGTRITGSIAPGREPGSNYRLKVPMDSGATPDRYQPTALQPMAPFLIEVEFGNETYRPIQMQGGYASLGDPAEETRLDLTLGLDSDGDGLPDAWKEMVIQGMGGDLSLEDVHPDGDLDGDGMTNFQEYIAGTYAWDSKDSLWMNIVEVREEMTVLDFLAIQGRTYAIEYSTDLKEWTPVRFRLPGSGSPTALRADYFAPDVRILEAEVHADQLSDADVFYRLKVR